MIKTYQNEKAIKAYRFVKFSANNIENTATSKDNIIGISDTIDSNENDTSDIYLNGEIAEIEAGGAFNAGDALTSDSEGRAILALENDNIGAIAHQSASATGDIVKVIVTINRVITAEVNKDNA